MSANWKIEVYKEGTQWRWKLINRRGDLMMVSREKCPTRGGALLLAKAEIEALKQTALMA